MDDSSAIYLIKRQTGRGWSITRHGEKVGEARNVVDAIELANKLAERASGLSQQETRVVFMDEWPLWLRRGESGIRAA